MIYFLITAGVFVADLCIKHYMDKNYTRKTKHPRMGGRIILEKYYNNGATLNLLSHRPQMMRLLHTIVLVIVGVFSYFLMRLSGRPLEKTGIALLLGGGLSNLFDRYTKGHVVDYFHINIGPKYFRSIIFNISDFCIFIGALLSVLGAKTAGN